MQKESIYAVIRENLRKCKEKIRDNANKYQRINKNCCVKEKPIGI